jgi:hypothetical protein
LKASNIGHVPLGLAAGTASDAAERARMRMAS